MNSKALIFFLLAAVIYGGFVWAHKNFDQRPGHDDQVSEAAFDASGYVKILIQQGQASVARVEGELEQQGKSAEAFLSLLPVASELWFKRVQGLESASQGLLNANGSLVVAMPKGLQSRAPMVFQVNRNGAGSAWVQIVEDVEPKKGARVVLAHLKVPVNVPQSLPKDLNFTTGHLYRLIVSDHKDEGPYAYSQFKIIEDAARQDLRRAMAVLRRNVLEVRPRVYMQACVAMTWMLYDDAANLLFDRLPKEASGSSEIGLIERLVFLTDYGDRISRRNQLIALLKSLR